MNGAELIPILEPILGIALAMNLAYLNLPIFGFLTNISSAVSEKISSIPDAVKREVENTQWYLDAVAISKVKNLEKLDLQSTDSAFVWTSFKSTVDSILFNFVFKWRLGRILSFFATGYASYLIILGVMVQAYPADPWTLLFVSFSTGAFFWSLFCFLWPICCISIGAWIKYRTIRDLNYSIKHLGTRALMEASSALTAAETAVKS